MEAPSDWCLYSLVGILCDPGNFAIRTLNPPGLSETGLFDRLTRK